jgi:hypothetical protein
MLELSWCTPLLSVEAEAFEENREEGYIVQLTPGRSYLVVDLDEYGMFLGRADEYPVVFYVPVEEPEDWKCFLFTNKPLPWDGNILIWVPLGLVRD